MGNIIAMSLLLAVGSAALCGLVMNIFKLIGCDLVMSGEEVVRTAGILVAPLGAVLGYF
jgi:hypothetical protein